MTPDVLAMPISALHEILNWSATRPGWQRDALRRIITQDALSSADVGELERLCRSPHAADSSTDPAIVLQPLSAAHLPPAPGAGGSVHLVSVSNLKGVNRLPSNQLLEFGEAPGLTIIFGDNGAGKSGYARVVKKACRTRGTPPAIRPDAFKPQPASPATADISFKCGGITNSYGWTDGTSSDARLANIFVFDASTADHYLAEDGPAAFTPHGLDVLPKLSEVADAITARLKVEIDSLERDIRAVSHNWKYVTTTTVGAFIQSLSATTSESKLEALSSLTAQESQRLRDVNDALKSDPKQKAKETRASAARLRSFASAIGVTERQLSAEECLVLESVIKDAVAAETAAKAFATGTFDESHLPGTGGDLWRQLFGAARKYSVGDAYKGRDFPVTDNDAKCVLCQQINEEVPRSL